MSGQPQEKWLIEVNDLRNDLSNLKVEDINSFKAKLINKKAKELYDQYPINSLVIDIYALSFMAVDKIDMTIKVFEQLILPTADLNSIINYINIYLRYSNALAFNHEYKDALFVISELEKIPEKTEVGIFYPISVEIYFENQLYKEVIKNCAEEVKYFKTLSPSNGVYSMFAYYHYGKRYKVYEYLKNLARTHNMDFNTENLENIFNLLENILLDKPLKKSLTDLEKESLEKIKPVAKLYIAYSLEEIYFDEKICFKEKELTLKVSRLEEVGFYGEISEIDDCYTEAETIEELKDNILKILEKN